MVLKEGQLFLPFLPASPSSMDEDLLSLQVERMKLTTEDKRKIFDLEEEEIESSEKQAENAIVCKLMTAKNIKEEMFKMMMPRIWNNIAVKIENVGKNIFLCYFKYQRDKTKVINNGAWFFDKALMIIEEPRADSNFNELEFRYAPFWIHFHELPFACYSRKSAVALGNLVGRFEKIETDEEGKCWGQILRVRILIDVSKPLRRGILIKVGSMSDEKWILITYKKLPDFC